jgi:acyl-CoA thioester hydrolase
MNSIYAKTFPVRWADADPNWHMTHSAYFEYAAHVRMSFLTENGYPPAKFIELGFGPVLLREEIKYHREIVMQEEITVNLKLASVKKDGRRWTMQHTFVKANNRVAAELTVDGGWLDFKARRLVTPPQALFDLMDLMSKTDGFCIQD